MASRKGKRVKIALFIDSNELIKKKPAYVGTQRTIILKRQFEIGGKYTFKNIWSPLCKLTLDSLLSMSKYAKIHRAYSETAGHT